MITNIGGVDKGAGVRGMRGRGAGRKGVGDGERGGGDGGRGDGVGDMGGGIIINYFIDNSLR